MKGNMLIIIPVALAVTLGIGVLLGMSLNDAQLKGCQIDKTNCLDANQGLGQENIALYGQLGEKDKQVGTLQNQMGSLQEDLNKAIDEKDQCITQLNEFNSSPVVEQRQYLQLFIGGTIIFSILSILKAIFIDEKESFWQWSFAIATIAISLALLWHGISINEGLFSMSNYTIQLNPS